MKDGGLNVTFPKYVAETVPATLRWSTDYRIPIDICSGMNLVCNMIVAHTTR
jgi:hypothetical protein